MYDKKVKVILKDGTEVIGFYNDEFYEDCAIFVNYEVIKISDIEKIELDEGKIMKEIKKEERNENLINQLLKVWEDSVKATHNFLSNEEIEKIKEYVPQALSGISHLIIATDENERPIAFMGIEENKLEMLFIKNSERGKGLGKQLLNYGIEKYNVNELAVNEQNPEAKGFYEHIGFEVYQRNELDDQGNPYPVLYMRLKK